jgi:hypothetical protein
MAISEVPKKKDESFDKLNVAEDRKLILSLLNEYSEKLLKVCEQSEEIKISWNIFFATDLPFMVVIFMLNLIVFSSDKNFNNFIISTFICLSSYCLTSYILSKIDRSRNRANKLKNSNRIAVRLERVISIASQFNEQVTTNFASRIEFDFRLTDAEEVLERYRYLSEKHRKSIRIFN